MNIEKFTDRAKGFLQAAQTIALRETHQRVTSAHLLKALLDDPQGMASGLIKAAGGDPSRALLAVDSALGRLPKVSGDTQLAWEQDVARILDSAEQVAQKAGDSFVTVERLLLACALAPESDAGKALKAANATPQGLNGAIETIRKGRAANSAGIARMNDG